MSLTGEILYLQQYGFCQVASAAALIYDYVLVFGNEVDLIWSRKWNLVTLLYAIVRYISFFLILDTIFYTNNLAWSANVSLAWYEIRTWGIYVFRIAMDIIMMKRLHGLSQTVPSRFLSSPKTVLAIIVTGFIVKNALSITMSLMALGPGSDLVYNDYDIAGTHVCGILVPLANILVSAQIPILVFEVLMFVLAFSYFVADIWGFWRSDESKVRQVGDLVRILVRDSTIYFAIIVAATALDYGNLEASGPTAYAAISTALQNFLPFCFAPRLVINMKGHKNRVHMSEFGEEVCDMACDVGVIPPGMNDANPA